MQWNTCSDNLEMRGSLWYNGGALNGSLHRDANSVAPCMCVEFHGGLFFVLQLDLHFFSLSFFISLSLESSALISYFVRRSASVQCTWGLRPLSHSTSFSDDSVLPWRNRANYSRLDYRLNWNSRGVIICPRRAICIRTIGS